MQNQHIRTYLVYGDSGSGKSTFINSLGGIDQDNQKPQTGGLGVAVTIDPGRIYYIQDEVLGNMQLIDTRGTWDPGQINNDQILQNLVKTLLDYSVHEMSQQVNPIQQLDGILYIHNSFIDRYARDTRIKQLGILIGSNLHTSTLTIMTRCKEIQNTNLKFNFYEWNKKLHNSEIEYIHWDSVNPLENQKEKLKELLLNLKPIPLSNIKDANQEIIKLAKELQLKDLIEIEEPRVRTIIKQYTKEKLKKKTSYTNVTLTINPPKGIMNQIGGWVPIKIPYLSGGGNLTTTSIRIDADFPSYSLPPKLILYCDLDKSLNEIKGQNLEIIKHEFINNGDYYDANFQYRWNGINNENVGRVDLKIKMIIQYRQIKQKQREDKEEYFEKVMKPRYSDEKPYIQQAMEQQFDNLYEGIKRNFEKQ
ncbi:unnamed protein product [Paramecium pentaurelia]|uniref:G domain-containing protein n=1 Tax=Paramecium pentaurelia TaxID=43138 RepID=A0A8S1V8L2_9CILI|nr:unnamed protein product [Paramecium pentaurelia]